jgi:hypothetical protein
MLSSVAISKQTVRIYQTATKGWSRSSIPSLGIRKFPFIIGKNKLSKIIQKLFINFNYFIFMINIL